MWYRKTQENGMLHYGRSLTRAHRWIEYFGQIMIFVYVSTIIHILRGTDHDTIIGS